MAGTTADQVLQAGKCLDESIMRVALALTAAWFPKA
jgi:hypothetical protein